MTRFVSGLLRRATITPRHSVRAGWLAALGCGVGIVGCYQKQADNDPPEVEVPDEDAKALAEGNREFAIDLYKRVAAEQTGGIILSPYSVSAALAAAYAGARGETADQIAKVLHFKLPPDRLFPAYAKSLKGYAGARNGPVVRVANGVWYQRDLDLQPEFKRISADVFRAAPRAADFAADPDGNRRAINDWVSRETEGKIADLLGERDITQRTRFVIANAVYFLGRWKTPFRVEYTRPDTFHVTPGVEKTVPMMNTSGDFRYYESGSAQMLGMPYEGGKYLFVAILPLRVDGLADVERGLTPAVFDDFDRHSHTTNVTVYIPRGKMEQRVQLKDHLTAAGMTLPFNEEAANFRGVAEQPQLHISGVMHGASAAIDERGVEAAAATAVVGREPASMPPPPQRFNADHPYLYYIKKYNTNDILFIGRYTP